MKSFLILYDTLISKKKQKKKTKKKQNEKINCILPRISHASMCLHIKEITLETKLNIPSNIN